jgi:predicted  nucleic acid-binding Zn-ribbon protein
MNVVDLLQRLQTVDQEWDEKARRFQAVRALLEDESAIQALRQAQADRETALKQAHARLSSAELELGTLRQKATETQEALYGGRVRNPREVEGLRQGAEQLTRRIADLEDHALDIITQLEELEPATADGARDLAEAEQRRLGERRALIEEFGALRTRLQSLRKQRETLRGQIGQTEIALYDQLRTQKAGLAMAPVRDGLCQACRVSVPLEKVRIAQEGSAAVTCEGCGRILYH